MAAREAVLRFVFLLNLWSSAVALLSPKDVNFEVQALMSIKASLVDPHGIFSHWDEAAVDPCSWNMVTCSPDYHVIGFGSPSQNLSGTLSPSIGNLTNLQMVLLQNNNISGSIPPELERLSKLHTLDLSINAFSGALSSLSHLKSLQYLRLNNNSLSGEIPSSLANMTQLALLDLSYNNFSGPVPKLLTETFNVIGNPLICASGKEPGCFGSTAIPESSNLSNTPQNLQSSKKPRSHQAALVFGTILALKI